MFSDRSIFSCAALVCCAIPAYCQDPISSSVLRDLINAALANNQELAALKTRSLEAKGLLRQAAVKPPLTFDVGVASGRPLGTVGEEEYSPGLGRTIERGGKRSRRVELAEVRVAQVESEYLERLRQLSFEIKVRYVDALSDSRRRLQILDAMLAANQRSLDVTRARVAKGDAAQLDQSLLEVELGRVEADRASVLGLETSVLPQAQKNLEIVQQAYQLGQLRILDVLNEQRRLLDTRLAALENLSVAAKSFAGLERAVGGEIQ